MFTDVVVSPPTCYIGQVRAKLNAALHVAAQNCYKCDSGAFTGDIRLVSSKPRFLIHPVGQAMLWKYFFS